MQHAKSIYRFAFHLQCTNVPRALNARLRGWQRITTKLKYNNHNHRGSMGLETPRVDNPS
ncbi:hypothetical protein FXE85_09900 [Vibrio cholerae]|nr:hypothetical protein FXE85_09900 [Vibrio cholerae]